MFESVAKPIKIGNVIADPASKIHKGFVESVNSVPKIKGINIPNTKAKPAQKKPQASVSAGTRF